MRLEETGRRRLRASGVLLSGLLGTYAKNISDWAKIVAKDQEMSPDERASFEAELITVANGIHAIVEGERNAG